MPKNKEKVRQLFGLLPKKKKALMAIGLLCCYDIILVLFCVWNLSDTKDKFSSYAFII